MKRQSTSASAFVEVSPIRMRVPRLKGYKFRINKGDSTILQLSEVA
jgi:hypothetical protein